MRKWILAVVLLLPVLCWAGKDEAIEAYRTGDYAKAMTEFKALGAQGDAWALYYVGLLYDRGYGVPEDAGEAAKWYEKGAALGDSLSLYHLGKMAEAGRGVPKDLVAAYKWLSLSAAHAPSLRDASYTRKDLHKLEEKMTPEQVAEAKKLVASWKPEK
jgi:TPR repeat protein